MPFFVIAADGEWIRKSYETKYAAFSNTVAGPGRPLRYLFLDKLFQITVPVPPLSSTSQDEFLKALLTSGESAASADEADEEAEMLESLH